MRYHQTFTAFFQRQFYVFIFISIICYSQKKKANIWFVNSQRIPLQQNSKLVFFSFPVLSPLSLHSQVSQSFSQSEAEHWSGFAVAFLPQSAHLKYGDIPRWIPALKGFLPLCKHSTNCIRAESSVTTKARFWLVANKSSPPTRFFGTALLALSYLEETENGNYQQHLWWTIGRGKKMQMNIIFSFCAFGVALWRVSIGTSGLQGAMRVDGLFNY